MGLLTTVIHQIARHSWKDVLYPLLPCYQATSVSEINTTKKELIKITDILGKNTIPTTNTPLFYMYNDGSVEQKIIIK